MATINPLDLIKSLKGANPQTLAMEIAQKKYPNDPTVQQLIQMGQRGDTQGIEQFAQQFFAQNGRNFNSDLGALMSLLGKG